MSIPSTPPDAGSILLDLRIEELAVTMLADRSMERLQEQWEEDRKNDPS